jgi:hypothetical protein
MSWSSNCRCNDQEGEKSEQIGKEPIGGTTGENLLVVVRGSHNDVTVGTKWWDWIEMR